MGIGMWSSDDGTNRAGPGIERGMHNEVLLLYMTGRKLPKPIYPRGAPHKQLYTHNVLPKSRYT